MYARVSFGSDGSLVKTLVFEVDRQDGHVTSAAEERCCFYDEMGCNCLQSPHHHHHHHHEQQQQQQRQWLTVASTGTGRLRPPPPPSV